MRQNAKTWSPWKLQKPVFTPPILAQFPILFGDYIPEADQLLWGVIPHTASARANLPALDSAQPGVDLKRETHQACQRFIINMLLCDWSKVIRVKNKAVSTNHLSNSPF